MGLAAAAAIVLLCAVRGCIISRQPNEKPEGMLSISLYDRASGKTEEMPLEEYLIGVVGAEMPASFPLEALKAQVPEKFLELNVKAFELGYNAVRNRGRSPL